MEIIEGVVIFIIIAFVIKYFIYTDTGRKSDIKYLKTLIPGLFNDAVAMGILRFEKCSTIFPPNYSYSNIIVGSWKVVGEIPGQETFNRCIEYMDKNPPTLHNIYVLGVSIGIAKSDLGSRGIALDNCYIDYRTWIQI